jgi:hypothetical protein
MSVHQHRINELMASGMSEGAEIRSADGKKLGKVRAIEGAHFKVDAALRRDYWLSMAYVQSAAVNEVVMSFDSSDAGAYRLTAPVAEEDVAPPAKGEVILSEEEQRETREKMARELSEQRKQLAASGAATPAALDATVGEPVEAELERIEESGEDVLDSHLAERSDEAPLTAEDLPDPKDQLAERKLPMEPFPKGSANTGAEPGDGLDRP